MPWKDLGTKDRWLLVTAGLQAAATLGTFLVALVGIWQVAPIITYQVQQQEAKTEKNARQDVGDSVTDRFAADAVNWWAAQVASYARIVELTGREGARERTVTFQLVAQGSTSIAPGLAPDLLVVKAVDRAGSTEEVKVAVNENAMAPAQYLQCRINQGVFAGLDSPARSRVEIATQRYLQRYMVPGVPPPHVRADMSLPQLHREIALHQERRVEALQHMLGLKDMLDAALREGG